MEKCNNEDGIENPIHGILVDSGVESIVIYVVESVVGSVIESAVESVVGSEVESAVESVVNLVL